MTVDELVTLTEALLHGATLTKIRDGDWYPPEEIGDREFVVLVRFLAGERPLTEAERLGAGVPVADRLAVPNPEAVINLAGVGYDAAEKLADLEAEEEALEPGDLEEPRGMFDLGDGVSSW